MHDVRHAREDESAASFDAVVVRYPYQEAPAVGPVSLTIRRGERVLLLGPSGCGKSTLLLASTGLVPRSVPGEVSGTIRLAGEPVAVRDPAEWAGSVAHFFQDADQTLCGMRVEDEIAFALESRALPEATIDAAVIRAMRLVGLPDAWRERRTATLSGGEKQLVAFAATLVQEPALFLIDEPTAHLAPEAASQLHRLLVETGPERAVLIVDHRLDGLIASMDRVVVLDDGGRVLTDGPPRTVFRAQHDVLTQQGIWSPMASQLDSALIKAGIGSDVAPLTVDELLSSIEAMRNSRDLMARARSVVTAFIEERFPAAVPATPGSVLVGLEHADCAPCLGPIVLRDVCIELRAGEAVGIVGRNGAGKSTLAACLAGVLRPTTGRRSGPLGGVAFQNPETQFTEGSVLDEIAAALSSSLDKKTAVEVVRDTLARWGLADLSRHHPYQLSQGQKRRLALAALTATDRWPFLVLDEPLAGLDARGAAQVETDIRQLRESGRAVAMVTHDMDFALRLCPRLVVLGEGKIIADGRTQDLLRDDDLLARAGLRPPAVMPVLRWLEQLPQC